MSGLWVFVCGPSGAGKDSVIRWSEDHLGARTDLLFARRVVTRASFPGSDHDPVTPRQFARMLGSGGLVWRWEAHGFHYGVEARYAAEVAAGRVVVVNGSREHAGGLDDVDRVRVVQILAEDLDLKERLQRRGRDAPHEVAERLARNQMFENLRVDCSILNQGELAQAGQQLADYLLTAVTSVASRQVSV
jgi:phosphonate metabolism protein PhnN/1,5-bisphosphokinase (PRPP-forming)